MALLTLGTTWSFGVVIEHRETRPTLIEHRIQTSGHCLGSCASVLTSWGNQTGDGMVVALFQIQAGAQRHDQPWQPQLGCVLHHMLE